MPKKFDLKRGHYCEVCETVLDVEEAFHSKGASIVRHLAVFANFATMTMWHMVIAFAVSQVLGSYLFVFGMFFVAEVCKWLNYFSIFFQMTPKRQKSQE